MAARVIASIFGVWVFTGGFAALGIALLVAAGMPYDEAQMLLDLLAFLVFLGLFLWSYAAASVMRVWCVLAGGGLATTGAAWGLARSLA